MQRWSRKHFLGRPGAQAKPLRGPAPSSQEIRPRSCWSPSLDMIVTVPTHGRLSPRIESSATLECSAGPENIFGRPASSCYLGRARMNLLALPGFVSAPKIPACNSRLRDCPLQHCAVRRRRPIMLRRSAVLRLRGRRTEPEALKSGLAVVVQCGCTPS